VCGDLLAVDDAFEERLGGRGWPRIPIGAKLVSADSVEERRADDPVLCETKQWLGKGRKAPRAEQRRRRVGGGPVVPSGEAKQ